MKKLLLVVLAFVAISVQAQYVTGPNPVNIGDTQTYSFNNGTIYMGFNWGTSLGTIVTKWSSGTTYYATVQWNTAGTGTLSFLDQTYTQRGSLSVTVNVGTPYTTFSTVQNCNASIVTRDMAPASTDINWYWQTTSLGTSTTLGTGASITITTTGSLFLRARSISTGAWSSSSQSFGTITVVTPPAAPATATNGDVIGTGTFAVPISVSTVSAATSYRWYSVPTGGSVVPGSSVTNSYSPNVTSHATSTYYAESVNGNCPSLTRTVVYASAYMVPVLSATNSGIIDVVGSVTLSVSNYTYSTYAWIDGNGVDIPGATSPTYSATTAGNYKVRVTKGNSPAFTSTTSIAVFVLPAVPATSINGDVISNVSVAVPVSVSAVSGAIGYRWYLTPTGGSVIPGSSVTNTYSPILSPNSTVTYYAESVSATYPSSSRKSVVATVYPEPVLSVSSSGIIDVVGSVTLSVTNYSYATYAWIDGNGTVIPGATSATYPATTAGNYKVRVTIGNSPAFTSAGIQVVVLPAVPATSTNGDVISNASAAVPVSVSTVNGATGYRWYLTATGGSVISGSPTTNTYSPTLSPNSTVTYYVESLIGSYPSSTRKSVVATVHPQPVLAVTNNGIVDASDPVTLSVSNYTYSTYVWLDENNVVIPGATASTYSTNIVGTYKVRVTKGNSSPFTVPSGILVSNPYNFIISSDILVDNITTTAVANALPIGQRSMVVQYFDGLGRPIQTVVKQGTPDGVDIVQPKVYDKFDREVNHYLPYASTESNGHFKNNTTLFAADDDYTHNFYKTTSSDIAYDTRPFAKTGFDDSPLNRPLKSYGPGSDWHTNLKFVQSQYLVNVYGTGASQDQVILWTIDVSGMPVRNTAINSGFYRNGTLSISSTIDEQSNEVRLYTDRFGNIVLKMNYLQGSKTDLTSSASAANWARTYYIYDDLNNLRYVLQPELSKLLVNSTYNPTQTDLNNFAFQYKYDGRHRQIQKQVPGSGIIYMVYDYRDRLVLTQDANQRNLTTKEWTFIKYDVLNRPVLTGRYANPNTTQALMQSQVDTYYVNLTASQAWFETYIGSGAGNVLGYDNKSFPQTTVVNDYYTATYYDAYDSFIAPTGYTYLNESLPGQVAINNVRVRGLVTGVQTRNLTSNAWMRNVNYYDAKYHLIQTIGDHQKGTLRSSIVYDFPGRLSISKRTYVVNSATTTIKETYAYDNASRLLTVKHSINGAADIITVKNEYNELGQLIDKRLHSIDNGTNFKQSVDYRYNIRGWLTKINEADVSAIATGDVLNDYFGMELAYNTSITNLTSTTSYSGNISAIQWSKGNGGTLKRQAYSFDYDNMNRLVNANHFDNKIIGNTWLSNKKAYNERNLVYDLNGNINKLVRYGFTGFTGTRMDSLAYNYTGNRLNGVIDYGDAAVGFVNGTTGTSTSDYSYDYNGNLMLDNNKGITAITYNYLNLPVQINKGTDYVVYTYDASGRKLAQQVYGATPKTTDYIGELVFEGNVLKLINHGEGRILPDGAGWEYQYHLKDHLGNVRVTFTSKTQTTTSYTTNFEGATDSNFQNYTTNSFDLVDHTDAAGTVYTKTQLLNGGPNGRVGLAKSVAVMPGDQITFSAYVKYMDVGGPNTNSLILSLANAFGVGSGSTGEQLKVYNGLNSYAVGTGGHSTDDGSVPKAFVTILFFDKDYNLVDAAWDQVGSAGAQTSTVKQPPHDLVSITAKAPEAGYAYAFFSNEHPTFMNVYFDDATFSFTPSPIVSVSDYFPFGLQYNSGERTGGLEQKYLYNGKELQDELSLNWYDYGARMYMPEIGRWGVVDPLAEQSRRWSTYNYALNNPVRFIDPDGMSARPADDEAGHDVMHGEQARVWWQKHTASKQTYDMLQNIVHADKKFRAERGGNEESEGRSQQTQGDSPLNLKTASIDDVLNTLRGIYSATSRGGTANMSDYFDQSIFASDNSQHRPKFTKTFANGIQLDFTLGYGKDKIDTVRPYYPTSGSYKKGEGTGWNVDPTKFSPTYSLYGRTVTNNYPYSIAIFGTLSDHNIIMTLSFHDLYAFMSAKAFIHGD